MVHRKILLWLRELEIRLIPANFTVTTLNDSGLGSIRQAVADANANPGLDSVQIQAGLTGSVTLTTGPMTISDPLTINGPGITSVAFVIGTNYSGRVFIVNADTTIIGIGISGSSATGSVSPGLGGGILSTANLEVIDCGFNSDSASYGGAIYQTGLMLTLTRCGFAGNGAIQGASIWTTGTVSLQYCDFDSNRTNNANSGGGGIYLASGSLTLDSCSFRGNGSNNAAVGKGGAVYANGPFFAQNCTFSQNGAHDGGAIYLTTGGTLWNCTVAYNDALGGGNGGGINGNVTLESTIVSNNTGITGPDILGTVTAKYSAMGTSSGFTSYTDQGNNLDFGLNLQVEDGTNGHGGWVSTCSIQSTSPCKNAGSNPASLMTDARGFDYARLVGSAPDIGAFEIQPPPQVSIQINDGAVQRSRVTRVSVTIDTRDTSFVGGPNWEMKRPLDNAIVTLALDGPSLYTLTTQTFYLKFTGGPVESKSLADGVYQLRVFGSKIKDGAGQFLDGNGDGIGGDDYVSPTTAGDPNRIFRLFGDANGDGAVSGSDFNIFRTAFGGSSAMFDFDNDGSVSANDFTQFKMRFGANI